MPDQRTRLEHDLLGEKAVPADAYYGVQTARGLDNFHISGIELRLYPDFIKALAMVKMAAARANHECGQFSAAILRGIEGACQELIDGKLHDQFRLDVFQGGAGTSTNKAIVIAGVGNGNLTEAAVNTLAKHAKNGIACVRSSRVTTGVIGRNVELDDDKLGFVAAMEHNP